MPNLAHNAIRLALTLPHDAVSICDQILENSSKSHMKSSVFLHVFNDISTYAYVFTEYFLHCFSNLSIEFHVVLIIIIIINFTG